MAPSIPKRRRLSARAKRRLQLGWLAKHRGTVESPAGSNMGGLITRAQRRLGRWLIGTAWCGSWAAYALHMAGVHGVSWRQASVSLIEDDARACVRPFARWVEARDALSYRKRRTLRGSLVVLFGRGVHVETVRHVMPRLGLVITDGGNTSSGSAGSQSNGGGAFRRVRRLADVHGFAVVNYSNPED